MSSKGEEVVVDTGAFQPENVAPQLCQNLFSQRARRFVITV